VLLWGTVGRLSDPLVDRPDVHPEVHALYLLDAYGMGSAGASCFCAFRVGQLRRVDQLDDLHTAVYKAPLDSKRTQPNCFERGQRNPHGLEQAASGAPEDGHSPIVLVGDGKPSTGDRSQGPNPKFGFRVSRDGTYGQAPTRRRHRCHCPGWSFTARRAGRFQDLPVPPSHGRPRAERVFISPG